MNRSKVFFFDLEETVIECWSNPILCNKDKIISFIQQNNVEEVHIFSAAIWDDRDKSIFEKTLKSWLEDTFNIKILSWPSMTEVWKETQWKICKFENVQEIIAMIGKKRMFEDWCKIKHHKDSHCILLDDSFDEEVLFNKVHNTAIEVVDVNKVQIIKKGNKHD